MNEEMLGQEQIVDQNSQELMDQLEEPIEQQPVEEKKAKSAEYNFRELREKTERLERERNELARRMADLEQRNKPAAVEPEPEFNFGDDDLVEGKTVKKIAQRFEKKLEEYQRQQRELTTETMLKTRFNDFDSVVNENTINMLRERYPDVAATLHSNPDPYTKLSAAYKLIKDLNLYDTKSAQYEEDKALAQKNMRQPRAAGTMSPQSGTTPLHQANAYAKRYSDTMDSQLRAEMEDILKR